MLKSKKSLSVIATAALITLGGASVSTPSAYAGVGLATGNIGVVLVGMLISFVGAGVAINAGPLVDAAALTQNTVGCAVLFFGLVVLDDHGTPRAQFTSLSSEAAAKIGVTESERLAFNSSLEEINAVVEAVEADVASQKAPSVEFSHSRWKAYSADLDSEAARAAEKVAASALQAKHS